MTAVIPAGMRMPGQSSRAPCLDIRPSFRCRSEKGRSDVAAAMPERVMSGKQCSSSIGVVGRNTKNRLFASTKKNAGRATAHPRLVDSVMFTVRCSNLPGDGVVTNTRGIGSSSQGVKKNLRWTEEDVELLANSSDNTSAGGSRRVTILRALSEDMEANPPLLEGSNDLQEGFMNTTTADVLEIEARPQPISPSSFANNSSSQLSMEILMGGAITSDAKVMAAPATYNPKLVWFARSEEEENKYLDRAINAALTGAAVSYAITKVITVDHDYWQGWTVFEILKYAPLHNWKAYEEVLKSNPVLAKMMISGVVYSIGDWIGQCMEGKPILEFSRVRLLRSGLVGFCLHGSLSHYYYYVCEYLFPYNGWWVVPLKVAFDQTIWSAIWNSIYYVTLGLLRFESPTRILKDLRATFFPLLTAGWKLWPFAHLVTYGLIPIEQRLLWVDCVEIVWVTILSMFANEKSEQRLESGEGNPETVLLLSSDTVEENVTNDS